MVVTDTDAGKGLNLWANEAACAWDQFKDIAGQQLRACGFWPVVTPHVHAKAFQARFRPWFGDPEKGVLSPLPLPEVAPVTKAERDKHEDCCKSVYLGHKGVNHVAILRELVRSGGDLPVMVYEFDQHYVPGPVNRLCVYLTAVADRKDSIEVAHKLYKALTYLPKMLPAIGFLDHDTCQDIAPKGEIQFRNSDNVMEDVWLMTAVATFKYVPNPAPEFPDIDNDYSPEVRAELTRQYNESHPPPDWHPQPSPPSWLEIAWVGVSCWAGRMKRKFFG